MQRTLVLLKPDCLQRRLMGEVIARFESKGLDLIAMKMLQMTDELASQHYAEHVGKSFYPGLVQFITASPLVAMVIEGSEAISVVRRLVGATDGRVADPGTIRGDLAIAQQNNLVHASDSPESAEREMAIFFSEDEIHPYETSLYCWLAGRREG